MSVRTRGTALAALTVSALVLSACGGDEEPAASTETGDSPETVTITDARGEQEIPFDPERVVVYDVASLDTMDALGVDAVTGVPQGNLPSYLEDYAGEDYVNVGDLFEPDLESLPEADPDLIIIGGRSSAMYDALNDALGEVPIIDLSVDEADYLASITKNIETIGAIFGKEDDAGTTLALLTTGGKVTAYSVNSRFNFLFDTFGFQAATEELGDSESRHGESVSFEFIRDSQADRLFVIDRDAAIGEEGQAAEVILDNDLVNEIPAATNGDITYVDATAWYIVPGGLTGFSQILTDVESNLA